MKKHLISIILLTLLMSIVGVEASAHDIKVANDDGVYVYYKYANNQTELEVCYQGDNWHSYSNEYTGNVVIPKSVTFNGNTYPVTSIGIDAFYGCKSLTSVTIPNSVTSIGERAFYNCSSLTSIDIPNSVTSIEGSAFYGCSGLTSIDIPNSVTSIGWSAFQSCSSLASITIPNSVNSIGGAAFEGTIWYDNQPDGLVYAGKVAYKHKGTMPSNTNIVLKEGTLGIAGSAFQACSGLTSITIPNSVSSIGNKAFYNCSGLPSITIPYGVTNIGDGTFQGCSGLTSITIPNSVTNIGGYAFARCSSLASITIPNSVTSIGWSAFIYCTSLESVTIGAGIQSISYFNDDGIFGDRQPAKIIWLANTPPTNCSHSIGKVNYVANDQYNFGTVYKFLSSSFVVDGVRYVPVSPSERTCDAIDSEYNEFAEHVKIGETVSYKGITLTVDKVQPYVCYGNTFIKKAEIDLNRSISDYSFSGCTSLHTVAMGEQVSSIGNYAFDGCSSLQAIDIPNSATNIGTYAFQNCSSIPEIEIPEAVNKIDDYVFSGCSSLKDVIIDDRNTELILGSNDTSPLFSDCPLDSVYIGGDINYSSHGYSPFYRNTTLRALHITGTGAEISANEFYGCIGLKNVRIGEGVTTIGSKAFSGCSSLDFFAFGSSVETIGQEAFSDCTSVGEIISKATTPPTCGYQALDDINKWNCKLYVPDGTLATYQNADQWKDFFFAEEGEGSDNPGIHESEKCATPVITLADGRLNFTCQTAGVEFHYNITADGSKSGTGSQTNLSATYTITVHATKEGYDNSDTASKKITVGGTGSLVGDVNGDGIVDAADIAFLVDILLEKQQ